MPHSSRASYAQDGSLSSTAYTIPLLSSRLYKYVNDEIGNWIERHEIHLWRDDSYRTKRLTTRSLSYYQVKS
jgi:hypothetical protein